MIERDLFEAALELLPEHRAAYLDGICRDDPALRQRLNDLLAKHDRAASFLEIPAGQIVASVDVPIAERPGTVIGPYKLLEQIGEGGFGVVFMAEQTAPIRRKVALKVLKPGMDTRQVVARFEAERQALALMDHPSIAKVLDAGQTGGGRPYFAMDLVRGLPITAFCDQAQLTPRERLELFLHVCQAVQHAHQKGVIHRDLKPSNVLVTMQDDAPLVKVIDFGIAKALGQQLTDKTLFTGFAQMIGTPLYMSPEQAALSNVDVDTRSDIYSLGVLLYELLTGMTPFDKERFNEVGYDELRRIIREEEPPKPSTRITTLGKAATTLSARRRSDPQRLSQLCRGELDWIAMKALEKDRNRRYETAGALGRDIERFLRDEPVQACPPSATYRARKFVTRNKGTVIAASLILLCLAVGIFGTTWGMVRAEHHRQLAEAKEKEVRAERDTKAAALAAEINARQAERQARDQAMTALRAMTDEIVENQMARGMTVTEENKEFLRKIIKYFEGFAAITADDADSRAIRAEGLARVGLMRHRLGDLTEAETAYANALALRKQLAADFPGRPEFRRDLAWSHNDMGILLSATGRLKEAQDAYAHALALQKQLVADFPTQPNYRQRLARCHNNLGNLLKDTGRLKEAEAAYTDALAILMQLAADFPAQPEFRGDLAIFQCNLGSLLEVTGRLEEAETAYADALTVQKQLAAEFPTRPELHWELTKSQSKIGLLLHATGRLKEAEMAYADALAVQKRLAADFATRPKFRQELASSQNNLGNLLMDTGRFSDAEKVYNDALAIQKQLAADFPTRPELRQDLAASHYNVGVLLHYLGRFKDAETAYAHALTLRKQLAANFPTSPEFRRELGISHNNLGLLLKDTGRLEEAEAANADALALRRQLVADFPYQPDMQNDLAGTLVNLANLRNQHRDFQTALAYLNEALPHHQAALNANRRNALYRQFFRNNLRALVRASAGVNDQAAALQAAERLRDLGWDAPANACDAGCGLARCIPIVKQDDQLDPAERQAAVQFYGDQAMAMLRTAVARGFKNPAQMKQYTDLNALRDRDDFQKLLAELEASVKQKPRIRNQESENNH